MNRRAAFDSPEYRARHTLVRSDTGERIHLRTVDGPPQVREEDDGTAVVYGLGLKWDVPALVWGEWEQFSRGAFADTLKEHDQFHLIEHNYGDIPLARTGVNMTIAEGDEGLDYEARLNVAESARAREYVAAVRAGLLDKSSIGFSWENDFEYSTDYEKDGISGLYTYTLVRRLYEISGVKWPAHESSELGARAGRTPPEETRALAPPGEIRKTRILIDSMLHEEVAA